MLPRTLGDGTKNIGRWEMLHRTLGDVAKNIGRWEMLPRILGDGRWGLEHVDV